MGKMLPPPTPPTKGMGIEKGKNGSNVAELSIELAEDGSGDRPSAPTEYKAGLRIPSPT